MSNSLPQAQTRRTIHLPNWIHEDGTPVDIVIRRVSVKTIGMDAGMRIVSSLNAVAVAAQNAQEGDAQAVPFLNAAGSPPRPPEKIPMFDETSDNMPPEIKQLIMKEAELSIVRSGMVTPTYDDLCQAYNANPADPMLEMGPEWDELVKEIMVFSGDQVLGHPGLRGSPAEVERFPADARGDAERNGGTVGKNSGRTRKRKRR